MTSAPDSPASIRNPARFSPDFADGAEGRRYYLTSARLVRKSMGAVRGMRTARSFPRRHCWSLDSEERAFEIQGDDRVEVGLGGLFDGGELASAGVGEDDVDRPERAMGLLQR